MAEKIKENQKAQSSTTPEQKDGLHETSFLNKDDVNRALDKKLETAKDTLIRREEYEKVKGEMVELVKELPQEERLKFLRFYAKLLYSYSGHSGMMGTIAWKNDKLPQEFCRFSQNFNNPNLSDKLLDLVAILFKDGTNTNTYGNNYRMVQDLINDIVSLYKEDKDGKEISTIVNPFQIEAGTKMFIRQNNAVKEISVDELIIDEDEGIATVDGQDYDLSDLNILLADGHFMLKSGENYFGDLSEFEEKVQRVDNLTGKRVAITFSTGIPEITEELTIISSNKKELEEKYGRAYLLYLPFLFKVKIRSEEAKKEGEFLYNSGIKDIKEIK